MPYKFATESQDYADYASGQVFYRAPGHPAFPMRLTTEIFQRCMAIRRESGNNGPVTLYDPCCGGAYHLSTLAYLHWHEIGTIIASDIDKDILSFAVRNLNLLTRPGLKQRINEISALLSTYGKPSHAAALASATRLLSLLEKNSFVHQVDTYLFAANATNSHELIRELIDKDIDIVISDVPYGKRSIWQETKDAVEQQSGSLWQMLEALLPVLNINTVVAIAVDKTQKCKHAQYKQIERFKVGKRQVFLLQPQAI
ncbi:MAG TPA: hypothetical protein VI451_06125 [Anaerolineales bacterium]|nr:hypothetical protein [Anaerolineales bacterium]